jgi:hypothetical protein
MKTLNINIVKKDTKTFTVRLSRNGVAVDISGWYLYFTVKADFNDLDASAIISKNVLFPTNIESQTGIGYLELSSVETNIAIGDFYYDMKFIDTGYRETFVRGKLIILPSIRVA